MRTLLPALGSLALLLGGCALTSAALDGDDGRTVVRSVKDVNAARAIRARMLRAEGFDFGGVDVEVREGVVLLSGRVPRADDRIEAERIAWSAAGIEAIGNEVEVRDPQGGWRNARDGVLEKSVRTRLIASSVSARDLNVETHNGVIYILGMVDSVDERDHATRIAATTRGAREVVSYIKIKGEAPAPRPPSASAQVAPVTPRVPAAPLSGPTQTVPSAPIVPLDVPSDVERGAPFYIDPDSGEQVPVRYTADGRVEIIRD